MVRRPGPLIRPSTGQGPLPLSTAKAADFDADSRDAVTAGGACQRRCDCQRLPVMGGADPDLILIRIRLICTPDQDQAEHTHTESESAWQ